MESTKISSLIQRSLQDIHKKYPMLAVIVADVVSLKGTVFLVGGAVRDIVLELPIKDLDIEVHGLVVEQLEKLLKKYGVVNYVGKSFGVFRLVGLDIDWSMPRIDQAGRKPKVTIEPNLSLHEAFARRDLTMNAMGINLYTQEFIDPFNGLEDITLKQLRTPNPLFFIQDPLRFYRVMQFIGRFEFFPDDKLTLLCKTMNLEHISKERISTEFYKLLLKSHRPSLGIRWIFSLGRVQELFPAIGKLVGVPQDSQWHPEGDVFEHSMQAVDSAAFLCATDYFLQDNKHKFILLAASLCHDFGKAETTRIVEEKIRSIGHEIVGASIATKFLKELCYPSDIIESIKKLIRYHMIPVQLIRQRSSNAAFKKLAFKLAPQTTMHMLSFLCYADKRARNGESSVPLYDKVYVEIEEFITKSKQLAIFDCREQPILKGVDVIQFIQSGPLIGQLLKRAYVYQMKHGIQEKNLMILWLKNELKNQSVLKKKD